MLWRRQRTDVCLHVKHLATTFLPDHNLVKRKEGSQYSSSGGAPVAWFLVTQAKWYCGGRCVGLGAQGQCCCSVLITTARVEATEVRDETPSECMHRM